MTLPFGERQLAILPRRRTVHFSRMQKAEIQVAECVGRQSVKQFCFAVVSLCRSFEGVSLDRGRREVIAQLIAGARGGERFALRQAVAI